MSDKYEVIRCVKTEAGWHNVGDLILAEAEDVAELIEKNLIRLFVKTGEAVEKVAQHFLTDIAGVTTEIGEELVKLGFDTVEKLALAEINELTTINGVGNATAVKLIDGAKSLISGGE